MIQKQKTSSVNERVSTRPERVKMKQASIIQAARDAFIKKGYKQARMTEIARACDIADGTVYTYFQNKEHLAFAVVEDFYARLTLMATVNVDAQIGCEAKLMSLAETHLENLIKERRILELLPLMNQSIDDYGDSNLFDMNKASSRIFDQIIQAGLQNNEIRNDVPLSTLRDLFFGSLDYGSRTMILKNKHDTVSQFSRDLLTLLLRKPSTTYEPQQILTQTLQRLEDVSVKLEALSKTTKT